MLRDERFKALFINPDFQVDKDNEEFHMITPLVSKADKAHQENFKKQELLAQQFEENDVRKLKVIESFKFVNIDD